MARSPLCIASPGVALLWFYQRLPVPLQTLTLYLLRHMLLVLSHPFTLLCPSPHQHPSSSKYLNLYQPRHQLDADKLRTHLDIARVGIIGQ